MRVVLGTMAVLAISGVAAAQDYVGDQVCAGCHTDFPYTDFFGGYERSGHPWKLFRTAGLDPAADAWPWTPVPPLPVVNGLPLQWIDVEYVIGNYFWKARYVDRDGFIHTGLADESTQWNLATQAWVPYHAGEVDKPYNCGRCHTTGYEPTGNQLGLPGLIGTWTEDGVRCEGCHGPGSAHVDSGGGPGLGGGKSCSACHIRDTQYRMPWSGGFTRHHQQSEDWVHSPHYSSTNCTSCHNPHRSTVYEDGGLIADCVDCHAGDETNNNYVIPGMGTTDCVDCHMPFMGKSATASNEFTGDIRGHLFQIMTEPIAAVDNTYADGSNLYWNQDPDGQAHVTLDYACLGCHIDVGDGLTLESAATVASSVHTLPAIVANSLHETRAGKNYWYGAENGGFETFTNVPIADLGCTECHGAADANGDPYAEDYEPGCVDCHRTADWGVEQTQCYSCHGRQATEANVLGYSDVHRDAGMVCWDCHKDDALGVDDVHGDGMMHESMLEPGAIGADCENCHTDLPPEHDAYNPASHNDKIHCSACHSQTVISCYNCHFESQVESHVKRAKQPLHNFVMLVNREKDGKVYTASFQSLSYQGTAFVAFGPYTGHTTTRVEARTCTDCHQNFGGQVEAIEQYNATGEIRFAEWDDVNKVLSWVQGVVPIPADYEDTLKMDFITYDGDPSDPPGPSSNWSSIGKDTWDGHQLFFASPLTQEQMIKLGFDVEPACVADIDGDGFVGTPDLLALLAAWGPCPGCAEDIDGDGTVGTTDLLQLLADWGACP